MPVCFKEELNNELLNIDINNAELAEFTNTILSLLDKHALIENISVQIILRS